MALNPTVNSVISFTKHMTPNLSWLRFQFLTLNASLFPFLVNQNLSFHDQRTVRGHRGHRGHRGRQRLLAEVGDELRSQVAGIVVGY